MPRKEAPSGTAGGKHVYVDRVEWNLALRDAQAQVNALAKGEVDVLERPAFESYEQLKKADGVMLVNKDPLGFQYMGRFNHLHPPFNNAKVRQAAIAAMQQEPFLRAQVGVKEFYKPCASMYTCGTPYGTAKGSEIQSKSNMKKAQEMLKASGYDGTPVVILKPTDLAAIQKLPDVAAQLLRQAGFKVDLQAMDWNTVVCRRAKKEPPAQGGWNIFLTAWLAPDVWSPLTNAALGAAGEKSLVRLAERRADREAARPVRARDRRREEEGARRADPGARLRDRHARAARRVRQPARHAQERHRLGDRHRRRLLEH